jgi:uncharacterized membrane protein YsdA (DUF1294 family)
MRLSIANAFSSKQVRMTAIALCWTFLVNAWTMIRFWQDKTYAIKAQGRVPEAHLLGLALIGGSPAAFAARRLFHHKTRKEPFSTRLQIIAKVQVGFGVGLAIFLARAA